MHLFYDITHFVFSKCIYYCAPSHYVASKGSTHVEIWSEVAVCLPDKKTIKTSSFDSISLRVRRPLSKPASRSAITALSPWCRCDQVRAAGLQIWADRTLWTQFKHNHRSHNNELFGLKLCVYIDKQMAECVIGKKKTRGMRARASGPISTSTECGAGQCFQNRPSETAVRALRISKCCRGRDQETMKKWWNSWTFINESQEWRFQTKKSIIMKKPGKPWEKWRKRPRRRKKRNQFRERHRG